MQVQQIIGVDLSKKTIDLACYETGNHICIENSSKGFKELIRWMKNQKMTVEQTRLVMEHTGMYSVTFEKFLRENNLRYSKVNALEIKRSLGVVRGKSDIADAKRIALYGFEKQSRLVDWHDVPDDLKRVQMLSTLRTRLIKQRTAFKNSLEELRNAQVKESDLLIKSQLQIITALNKQIEKVEDQIQTTFRNNEALNKNYCLLLSIMGVGKVLATNAIIKTNNFTRFTNARKFACFCGTAPFEHTSGTSIKGRTRVSHFADKAMKCLLDLAAKTAIQHDPELKEFYQRRCKSGKSKMSTINIVRNKLLYRMFAVVKRQTPFLNNYLQVA